MVLVDALVVLDALTAFLTALTVLDAITVLVVLVAHLALDVATEKIFKPANGLVFYFRKASILLWGSFNIRKDIMDKLLYIRW